MVQVLRGAEDLPRKVDKEVLTIGAPEHASPLLLRHRAELADCRVVVDANKS